MRYKTGFCFTSRDLFENWDWCKLGIKNEVYYKKYQHKSLDYFLAQIFLYFMFLVLLDIIENNVTFVLPLIYVFVVLYFF